LKPFFQSPGIGLKKKQKAITDPAEPNEKKMGSDIENLSVSGSDMQFDPKICRTLV
jgi:hypothetical protein